MKSSLRHFSHLGRCSSVPSIPHRRALTLSCSRGFPRGSPGPSEVAKWTNYVNRQNGEAEAGSDVFYATNFGTVRLDSMNHRTVKKEEINLIGRIEEPTSDSINFFTENESDENQVPVLSESLNTSRTVQSKEHSPTQIVKTTGKRKATPPTTMKAYKFIDQLRTEALIQETDVQSQPVGSKEIEVRNINKSLQAKISDAMGFRNNKAVSRTDDDDGRQNSKENLGSKIDPKFVPTDLTKLTSVEVVSLLKNSVLYNEGKSRARLSLSKPNFLFNFQMTLLPFANHTAYRWEVSIYSTQWRNTRLPWPIFWNVKGCCQCIG